jgi:hypothetical protein
MRHFLLIVALVAFPFSAFAGPKEDAQAVFDEFLTKYTAANFDDVVGLFWPDALLGHTNAEPCDNARSHPRLFHPP